MYPWPPGPHARWCWGACRVCKRSAKKVVTRFRLKFCRNLPIKSSVAFVLRFFAMLLSLLPLAGCRGPAADPGTVRFLIESSPNSLDLRQGTDAQSERIGALIYDGLVRKDEHFTLQPALATSWERPDSRTWLFHVRPSVRFHDGKILVAEDVAWSIRSMTNGSLITSKAGSFAGIRSVEVSAPLTVTVRTSEPDPALLFNLSDGLFGVVENGAGRDEGLHPVGTGAFRFIGQVQDKEVVLERNPAWWGGAPNVKRVRFEVVPDNISMAMELKKGAADLESNAITPDEVHALADVPSLRTETRPGADVYYANFNVRDPLLRDPRVRQAIACAIDKDALISALWRGHAVGADTLLPPGHWAAASAEDLPRCSNDPARARVLLDAAGLRPDARGIRLRFTLKTSTDETTRLMAQVLQQQLGAVGIELGLRSAEFGTFYSDITRGAFQMYILRWTGSNEDPDIFRYAYAASSFPPRGGNRGHYANQNLDALLMEGAAETDLASRRRDYVQVQQILAMDLPSVPLWYPDVVVVHSLRVRNLHLEPGGGFGFLRRATLQP